ncbi:VOC family protein [Cohnella rhizosphaerae]|uniref:VOC family protein n=1 Tax=Cohnella rhizosphaerae TaxID=1457232 RepID=A0A9X4KUB7_9BACL|nr:VOC family protein [Cohnella rhizosphaerae]MDG0808312.1 VOC family protein [Cohnella rhizosphaerae]
MAVRKIEHVGIMTNDLERSIAFYAQIVGLVHTDTILHTNGIIRLAFLSFPGAGETELELIEGYDGTLAPEGRVHHVAFNVDDIEAEYSRVSLLDVDGLDAEITTLPNGSRYFFFRGPDGESLEFFQSTRGGNPA